MTQLKNYAVVGRIPYDDEDSCTVVQAKSVKDAERQFTKWIYAGSDQKKSDVVKENGTAVYINYVLESETPISIAKGPYG